jgi:hypothetical protein
MTILLLAVSGSSSFALDISIATPNAALSVVPGPYGNVNVNRTDSTHATITFTTASALFKFGGAQAIDVNVNATNWSVSGLTSDTGGTLSVKTDNNVNGFGSLNQTFDNSDGAGDSFTTASFVLTNLSGMWANDASVLAANSNGTRIGAHIFAFSVTGGVIVTGFAAEGGTRDTPEPATILSALTGLVSLGAFRRLRGRRQPADVVA